MPVLPQIDIRPGRTRVPSIEPVVQSFNAQLTAEQSRKAPLESVAEGIGTAQKIVTNQQAIAQNELIQDQTRLENAKLELAIKTKREQEAEDLQFIEALNTANPNDQLNALIQTATRKPDVLERNKQAALAIAQRIRVRGNDVQKQMVEEEVMPILDRENFVKEKQAETADRRARERIRLSADEQRKTERIRARKTRKSPRERALEREKQRVDLDIKREELKEKRRENQGEIKTPRERSAERTDLKRDANNFADQLVRSNTTIDPTTGKTQGDVRADDYLKAVQDGIAAFDRTDGQPTTIGGIQYKSQREYQEAVDKQFAKHLTPERRQIVGQSVERVAEDRAKDPLNRARQNFQARINPGETLDQAAVRVITPLITSVQQENRPATASEIESMTDKLVELAVQAGKKVDRPKAKAWVLAQLERR